MAGLSEQTTAPVLLAFDDVHTWFMKSRYRSPDFKVLDAYSLSMPLLMLDFISGRKIMVSCRSFKCLPSGMRAC